MYESLIVKHDEMYTAVILRLDADEPNCDTVKEHTTGSYEEAIIWCDDEMFRITTGKGVWDLDSDPNL
jgi:hypothetical protein